MKMERSSGILLHPTSFPSPYGIGDLGRGARKFIDYLYEAKQSLWQILPLNPTGYGDSPYQSSSTFALNELLISPDTAPMDALLNEINMPNFSSHKVDYGEVIPFKQSLYKKAYEAFKAKVNNKDFAAFCAKHKAWLDDFALFTSIKKRLIEERRNSINSDEYKAYKKKYMKILGSENKVLDYYHGAVWNSWPEDIANYEKPAKERYRAQLSDEIEYVKFLQYIVFAQWADLKEYANKKGIQIIGDIPIFAAYDSADLWANKELFQMKGTNPTAVAGVPPDYFSETGQLWGNPLYEWQAHKEQDFNWWISRLRHTLSLVDSVRIDHFRGFAAYWSVPFGAKTAVKGKWQKACGCDFFNAVSQKLKGASIIAEDLGVITDEVTALRKAHNMPGMKILQFGIEGFPDSDYLPHNFTDDRYAAYTGTHDNDTTMGWYNSADEKTKDYFRRLLNTDGSAPHKDLMRLLFSSTALWAIAPLQDVLGLGGDCRMNIPGKAEGNWQFRYSEEMLTEDSAKMLAYLSELYNRNLKDLKGDEENDGKS